LTAMPVIPAPGSKTPVEETGSYSDLN